MFLLRNQLLNIHMALNYGIVDDIVDDQTLDDWKKIYQKNSITKTHVGDDCWGIDKKSLAYSWFIKKVMPVITKTFKEDVKLIFSSFIDLHEPLTPHNDIKPLPEGVKGKHHVSILVPYSVNNQKDLVTKGCTRIYGLPEVLRETLEWRRNSAIWWSSEVFHDSGEFDHTLKSKQYFITHTYV